MRWIHHYESAASRMAIAISLSLFLSGAAGAQQIPLEEAVEPANEVAEPATAEPEAAELPSEAAADEPAEAAAPTEPPKPWTVHCTEATADRPSTCQMSQTLASDQTGQRLISVSIRSQPQGLSMVMALPHGLHLPGGVSYQIDSGQRQSIPITLSDEKGVYALMRMNDALFTSMKRGNTFRVSLVAPNQRQMAIPMTLAGFTAAANEMTAGK